MLISAAIVLAVVVILALLLMATDTLLSVYERLAAITPWLGGAYMVGLLIAAGVTGLVVWRLLRPNSNPKATGDRLGRLDRDDLDARLATDQSRGIDVSSGKAELAELDRRQQEQTLYLVLFGETSSGKSTLVRALLPDAEVTTDIRAGTTQTATTYHWRSDLGMNVRLIDLPGFGQSGGESLQELSRDEAIRAHVVIYVCDDDLSRSQFQQLEHLAKFRKPIVVALNKADQYRPDELGALEQRLDDRLSEIAALAIVPVVAGGEQQVLLDAGDGSPLPTTRARKPDVSDLVGAIQQVMGEDDESLGERQRLASLQLAAIKLDAAEQSYRRQQASTLVERYARRAVIGAMAAVAPGTDLVIQGTLATALVRELSQLYEVPVREIDLDRLVEIAGSRLGRFTAISLAVAGNALKAFPGAGTLAGGMVHAVAYGLIFDGLGRAIASCLDERAKLEPDDVIERLDQQLESDLATRAGQLARLALSQRSNRD